jgi:DNA-binding LytR/AlgR family response regulator
MLLLLTFADVSVGKYMTLGGAPCAAGVSKPDLKEITIASVSDVTCNFSVPPNIAFHHLFLKLMTAAITQHEVGLAPGKEDKYPRQFLMLPNYTQATRIPIKEIAFLEGIRNYTLIHLHNGRQYMSTKTLKCHEEELKSCPFFRVHKTYLVNMRYVSSHDADFNFLSLKNEIRVAISRRKRKDFAAMIKFEGLKIKCLQAKRA